MLNIYYCLVYSHLAYGIEAWGSACKTETDKLLILQIKAVRILTGNQYFQIYGEVAGPLPPSQPLFSKLDILKFDDIFRFSILNPSTRHYARQFQRPFLIGSPIVVMYITMQQNQVPLFLPTTILMLVPLNPLIIYIFVGRV